MKIVKEMRNQLKIIFVLSALALSVFGFTACRTQKKNGVAIAVFIPGNISGNPVYEMLVKGVQQSVNAYNQGKPEDAAAHLSVLEAGTNQADWGTKMTALTAEGRYDVIISSNPSMPDIVKPLLTQFPKQKYILLDAYCKGYSNITTIQYNQHEQSYLSGYIAALMSKSHKIGLIAAQEYPIMNNVILPGYKEGAAAAVPGTTVDFRIVGNWYDATKGADLSTAMADAGVDVILPICGGASQGVISSAKEKGFYIAWFDDNGFNKAPGSVISSSVLKQTEAAEKLTTEFLENKIEWGTAKTVGIKDGYIEFIQNDPEYIKTVPADVRTKIKEVVGSIKSGKLFFSQG